VQPAIRSSEAPGREWQPGRLLAPYIPDMIDPSRTTVLITGASSGIGFAMAEIFARRGNRLVLVSRDPERLHQAAAKLALPGSPEPVAIPMDLYLPGAAAELARATEQRSLQVDVLVNNAGHSLQGRFAEQDPSALERMLQLDVVATTLIARAYLPGMLERRCGAIVNVASIAAFLPFPTQAAYGASKAFVLALSEAIWAETRGTGVRVLALCPGPTDTGFFRTLGRDMRVAKSTPEFVAAAAVAALERDAMTVVPGFLDNIRSRILPRLLPRRLVAWSAERILSRMYR